MRLKRSTLLALVVGTLGHFTAAAQEGNPRFEFTTKEGDFFLQTLAGTWRSITPQVSVSFNTERVQQLVSQLAEPSEETHSGEVYRYQGFESPKLLIEMRSKEGREFEEIASLSSERIPELSISIPATIASVSLKVVGSRESYRCNEAGEDCRFQTVFTETVYAGFDQKRIETEEPILTCENGFLSVGGSWDAPTQFVVRLNGEIPEKFPKTDSFTNYLVGSSNEEASPGVLPEVHGEIPDFYGADHKAFRFFSLAQSSDAELNFTINTSAHRFCQFVEYDYQGSGRYRIKRIDLNESCEAHRNQREEISQDFERAAETVVWEMTECRP